MNNEYGDYNKWQRHASNKQLREHLSRKPTQQYSLQEERAQNFSRFPNFRRNSSKHLTSKKPKDNPEQPKYHQKTY